MAWSPGDWAFDAGNRLQGSARFRSWAQKIPFFQRIANRRARRLFALASGFVHSQVLFALSRGGVFELLSDGAESTATIARALAAPPARVQRLLRAAAALELLEERPDGRFGLGPIGAAMHDNTPVAALVHHHETLYRDLADPLALLSEADAAAGMRSLWPYAGSDNPALIGDDGVHDYTALMAASQRMVAEQVLDAYPLSSHRRVLDIAGGSGALLIEACTRWPQLDATLAELPAVARMAQQRLESAKLLQRVDVIATDVFRQPLPEGCDVALLVRVLHDHDDARVLSMLAAVREALPPGGVLVIGEPMAASGAAGRLIEAYFSVYLLAMGSGRPRTAKEYSHLLSLAGFSRIERRRTRVPLVASVLVGHR